MLKISVKQQTKVINENINGQHSVEIRSMRKICHFVTIRPVTNVKRFFISLLNQF